MKSYIETLKTREELINQLAEIEKQILSYKYTLSKNTIKNVETTITIKSKVKTKTKSKKVEIKTKQSFFPNRLIRKT